jgi:hypothetical protein
MNKRLSDSRRNRLEWQRVNLHQFHIIRMSSRPLFGPVRTGSKTPEEISARSLTSTCQTTALHLATKVGQESIWTVGHTEWRIFAPRLTSSKTHARWRSVASSGRYTWKHWSTVFLAHKEEVNLDVRLSCPRVLRPATSVSTCYA